MGDQGIDTEILIILSMLNRIILDDLLLEVSVDAFDEKKRWHDKWRERITEIHGLEGGLLDWDSLKDKVVEWLKGDKTIAERKAILDRCLMFLPYGPFTKDVYYSKRADRIRTSKGDRTPSEAYTLNKVQASEEARELSLEKICRLLGLEGIEEEIFIHHQD